MERILRRERVHAATLLIILFVVAHLRANFTPAKGSIRERQLAGPAVLAWPAKRSQPASTQDRDR